MTWSVSTLLLIAVAIMASRASVPPTGPAAPGLGCRATRFVCAKCTETGQLSRASRGLFLSRAAVLRHIAASKPCRAAKLGIREIQVDVLTSDAMAGAGGGAGPAPDVRHQPELPRRYRVSRMSCLEYVDLVLLITLTEECTLVA